MTDLTMVCPCHFGLESVLAGEMKRLGFQNVACENGTVRFEGSFAEIARANLQLRTAERVLIELGRFPARSFDQLFEGTRALPWERFIGTQGAFPVKGWALNSKLHSVPDCQSIIKKAIVRRLEKEYNIHIFPETGEKYQVQFSLLKDEARLYLDTSGAGLHKRGYRPSANAAPIKETLAAGILDLARVRGACTLYDPMCGSGTLLIEGALRATRTAPGLRRSFAAEKWGCFDAHYWQQARREALDLVDRSVNFRAVGADISVEAAELTRQNAKRAEMTPFLTVSTADISSFKAPESGIVVVNPPYGERLEDLRTAEALYRRLGKAFVPKKGVSYYIISPHEQFESFFGRPADKKRKLYNGMIRCNLYQYFK